MYIRQGDVECRALQVARADFILDEVDHHLALGRYRHCREDRLRLCALERRGGSALGGTETAHVARIAVLGYGCHILQREAFGLDAVDGAVFLKRIVCYQSLRIDLGGVDSVVHIAQQPALRERGAPYTHLIHNRHLRILGKDEYRSAQVRYLRLGDDGRARTVQVERSRLTAYHVERYMMPAVGRLRRHDT